MLKYTTNNSAGCCHSSVDLSLKGFVNVAKCKQDSKVSNLFFICQAPKWMVTADNTPFKR